MKIVLVKPPEKSSFNFGSFSLAVLAAALEDIATLRIIDATTMGTGDAAREILAESPGLIGITAMGPSSVPSVVALMRALRDNGFSGSIIAGGHGYRSCTGEQTPLCSGRARRPCGISSFTGFHRSSPGSAACTGGIWWYPPRANSSILSIASGRRPDTSSPRPRTGSTCWKRAGAVPTAAHSARQRGFTAGAGGHGLRNTWHMISKALSDQELR